jgi:RNA polymerase sigma-70 factor (ECF subfamily)
MRSLALANPSALFVPAAEAVVAGADASAERANAAMERYASGNDAAFADVYDAVAPRIHGFLLRQTRDPVAADDLLQKTLLQMHRKRGTYVAGLSVLPWAYAIARRLCIDEFRRRKTDTLWSAHELADDHSLVGTAPDDEVGYRQLLQLLETELRGLPETQRAAFELLRIEGLTHDQAAQVLGTTVNAVKLRAFRAYSAIRAVLGARAAGPGTTKTRRSA